jgi:5'-methylthioadenosine phosphorylase
MDSQAKIGVIGGSGLYEMDALQVRDEVELDTPWGKPSDKLVVGSIAGAEVAFLARHGVGHRILPSELNFRANIFAMKLLGVERIISVGAVGSLREDIPPLDIVLVDQFIDRAHSRSSSFFGEGIVVHMTFGDPICPELRGLLAEVCEGKDLRVHPSGTYVCMEGPQFSTRAESNLYRSWGADVIGMTNLQEAKLAREAEICYATLALVTDYDCWHASEDEVTIEMIIENLTRNAAHAQQIIADVIPRLGDERNCGCASALQNAILTEPSLIPFERKRALEPLIGKYL